MKLIQKIFIILLIAVFSTGGLILMVANGRFDRHIKAAIEAYLSNHKFTTTISQFKIRNRKIIIDHIYIDSLNDGFKASFSDVNITFDLKSKPEKQDIFVITASFNDSVVTLNEASGKLLWSGKLNGAYLLDLSNFTSNATTQFLSINNTILSELYSKGAFNQISSDSKTKSLEAFNPHFTCEYKIKFLTPKTTKCSINFTENSSLIFDIKNGKDKIIAHSKLQNIPIILYKLAEQFAYNNSKALVYLNDLKDGIIENGFLNLIIGGKSSVNDGLNSDNFQGELNIKNLEYKYNLDFPPLTNMDLKIRMNGPEIQASVSKAYSTGILINDGKIAFNWLGMDDSKVVAEAQAKGNMVYLTDFISNQSVNKAKKFAIDFKSVTGIADLKINITIPISPNIENSYNISSEISNFKWDIFNKKLNINANKITGIFNGKNIIIEGDAKINNLSSKVKYQYNVASANESPSNSKNGHFDDFEQLIQVTTNIANFKQDFEFLQILTTKTPTKLDFELKHKNNQNLIKINADLRNTDFYIDKLAIHKQINENGNLLITGVLQPDLSGKMEFKITGEHNLNIAGSGSFSQNKIYQFNFAKIAYRDTDLSGKFYIDESKVSTSIYGKSIDLSTADMMQLLKKETSNKITEIDLITDKIMLKNGVTLDNFNMNIRCDKVRCFSGQMNSKLGARFVSMKLNQQREYESWDVKCDNAGALFRGIGMYNNMKNGILSMTINTKKQQAKQGQIIPVIDGNFELKKFLITTKDAAFLTKVISFISLPGFFNFVTNQQYVGFSDMTGHFAFDGNVVNIYEAAADGPFFDFTMHGNIDTAKRMVHLKGRVVPSIYGISTIIKKLPILGDILSGGHRKGIVSAPYSIQQKY